MPRVQAPPPRPYGRLVVCCWPIGEPGTREFHFCGRPSEPAKVYCADHCRVAYVKTRPREDQTPSAAGPIVPGFRFARGTDGRE